MGREGGGDLESGVVGDEGLEDVRKGRERRSLGERRVEGEYGSPGRETCQPGYRRGGTPAAGDAEDADEDKADEEGPVRHEFPIIAPRLRRRA